MIRGFILKGGLYKEQSVICLTQLLLQARVFHLRVSMFSS